MSQTSPANRHPSSSARSTQRGAPATLGRLVFFVGNRPVWNVPLDGSPIVIGRAPANQVNICLPPGDSSAAAQHAIVWFDGETFRIRNLKNTNTYVNGNPVKPESERPVPPHAQIQLGRTVMLLDYRTPTRRQVDGATPPTATGVHVLPREPDTSRFPAFEIEKKLGGGTTSVVYRARWKEDLSGELVALKVLRPKFAAEADMVAQFRKIIEMGEKLSSRGARHQHIVWVAGVESSEGLPAMVMEYVSGGSLRKWLVEIKKIPFDSVYRVLEEICLALQHVHKEGYIHRDIKPENILLTETGEVKLCDFGFDQMGTPEYMSPEQVFGLDDQKKIDARSDIYSLCVVAFELCTGRVPFKGTRDEVMDAHSLKPPPDPANYRPDIPPALKEAILAGLRKECDGPPETRRLQTVDEFCAMIKPDREKKQ